MQISLSRAYDSRSPTDGIRILVERLWPRGLTRERAAIDLWLKQIAPSPELRKWFGHDPARWEEFQRKYLAELDDRPEEVLTLMMLADVFPVTLVFGSREREKNSANVLKTYLEARASA